MFQSSDLACLDRRKQQCAYNECDVQILSPMRGKYCKTHRQKVYKRTYLKKSSKLKAKYKESKQCFSGSPDFFDGQDIEEMLQQVLFKKRMELMCCTSVVNVLQVHQNAVKAKMLKRAEKVGLDSGMHIKNISKGDVPTGSMLNSFANNKDFLINQKIVPERFDRGLANDGDQDKETLKPGIETFQYLQSQYKIIVKPEISPTMGSLEINRNLLNESKQKLDLSENKKERFLFNSIPGNLERRSAFQETGAGDAKSLIAVRTAHLGNTEC